MSTCNAHCHCLKARSEYQMAFALQDNGELLDFLGPRQAALIFEFHNIPYDLCDNIFANVTANIEDCVYYDLSHQFAESSTGNRLDTDAHKHTIDI